MSEFVPGSTSNVYKDIDGNDCSLFHLVNESPEWARSRIREGEKAAAELAVLKRERDDFKDSMEYWELQYRGKGAYLTALREAAGEAKDLLWKMQNVQPYSDEIHYVGALLNTELLKERGTMSEFMEWAEGDDFITEDTDVRESCESAWDAAWALQGHRIAELKKTYKEMISQSQDQILELQTELAALREKGL